MVLVEMALLSFPSILGLGSAAIGVKRGHEQLCGRKNPKVNKINPPKYVFAIVWPLLYIALGIALMLLYKTSNHLEEAKAQWVMGSLLVFTIALAAWWVTFTHVCAINWARGTIIALTVMAGILCYYLSQYSLGASMCLVPMTIWLSFASLLTLQ